MQKSYAIIEIAKILLDSYEAVCIDPDYREADKYVRERVQAEEAFDSLETIFKIYLSSPNSDMHAGEFDRLFKEADLVLGSPIYYKLKGAFCNIDVTEEVDGQIEQYESRLYGLRKLQGTL